MIQIKISRVEFGEERDREKDKEGGGVECVCV
jgi:hypothetical protein